MNGNDLYPLLGEPDWDRIAQYKKPVDSKGIPLAGCWSEGEMVGFAECMVERVLPLIDEVKRLKADRDYWRQEFYTAIRHE